VVREPGSAWALKPLGADFNLSALKNTYDYSCFLARSNRHQHSMTF
jgi:hypothetical protein